MIQEQLALNNRLNTFFITAIIFLLNFSLKLIHLTHDPLWYDECFSVFYGQGSISDILNVSGWDINPPFFFIILSFWMKLFGISELSVRIFPVLFSSLTGVVLYLFLKKYFNFKTAISASVLYLFSNISFYYAHEVRAYSFILFVSTISIWLFIKLLEKPALWLSIALAATYYMLIMSHYLTFFILLSQGLLFLLFFNKSLLKYYLLTVLFFVLFLSHWFSRLYEIISGGSKHWLQSPTIHDLTDFIVVLFNGEVLLFSMIALSGFGALRLIIKK